jgi:glycosyltransferase involved in cell wall biosynthesis
MSSLRPEILQLPYTGRKKMYFSSPIVSVITPNYNHAHYLNDTLVGVNRQSYQNLEHIVIDGGSSDNTIEILKNFPDITWVSEPDKGVLDAFLKGLRIAKGKYVMMCQSSDMYIDAGWIENCVEIMERDSTISLVWGGVAIANIDGEITERHSWPASKRGVPSGIDMFFYWLTTSVNLPETNYCIRRDILESCLSEMDIPENEYESDEDINLLLQFRFHSRGYLGQHLPRTANFVRVHTDQRTLAWQTSGLFDRKMATYGKWHKEYRKQLLTGRKTHVVRDSNGEVIRVLRWFHLLGSIWKQKLQIMLKGHI